VPAAGSIFGEAPLKFPPEPHPELIVGNAGNADVICFERLLHSRRLIVLQYGFVPGLCDRNMGGTAKIQAFVP